MTIETDRPCALSMQQRRERPWRPGDFLPCATAITDEPHQVHHEPAPLQRTHDAATRRGTPPRVRWRHMFRGKRAR
jgi:hypothetical protein